MFNKLILDKRVASSSSYFSNFSTTNSKKLSDLKTNAETVMKPPNILIYSPESSKPSSTFVQIVENCLASNFYTCYFVTTSTLLKDPWVESTKALIVINTPFAESDNRDEVDKLIQDFLKSGGKLLNFSMELQNQLLLHQLPWLKNFSGNLNLKLEKTGYKENSHVLSFKLWPGYVIENATVKNKLICINDEQSSCVSCYCGDKKNHIFSTLPLLDLDNSETISESKQKVLMYLLFCLGLETKLCSLETDLGMIPSVINDPQVFLFSFIPAIQTEFFNKVLSTTPLDFPVSAPGLKFVSTSFIKSNPVIDFAEDEIAVIFSSDIEDLEAFNHKFDWETYRNSLFSERYGKLVCYADIIPTTMTLFDGICCKLPCNIGPIAIARQQSKGVGRAGNKWLSPVGCAMFTLVVHVPLKSYLGVALPFLQHLTTVAAVHAIRTLPGFEKVNLTVKWPNDIYYGTSVKLGGVLVKSSIINGVCIASIGCGVNISNSKPTVCVNHLLKENYGIDEGLKCEKVIARTVSYLEQFIDTFQQHGSKSFLQLYYSYWIHNNAEVTVVCNDVSSPCTIIGVDEFGYLRARRRSDNKIISLHPDGNSFDITKNLIVAKKTR